MIRRSIVSSFTLAALVCALVPRPALAFVPPPVPQSAPETPTDEVRLTSGGFIRGEIVESVPGSHVSIIPRGSSESRRIEWAEISEVVRDGQPAATPPSVDPPPTVEPSVEPTPAPIVEPPREGPIIHINQTGQKEPMLLLRIDGEAVATSSSGYTARAVAFSEVCESPCDIVLGDHGGEFFVKGSKKYSPSKRFRLSGDSSRFDLDVTTRSRGMMIGGYAVAVTAVVAASFMSITPILVDMPKRPHAVGTWVGAGLVGVFGIGGGVAMMFLGRSKVRVRGS